MDITASAKPVFKINVPLAGIISCRACTVGTYRRLCAGTFSSEDIKDIIIGEIPAFLQSTLAAFAKCYISETEKYFDENCDTLRVPDSGERSEKISKLNVSTFYDHCVYDYSGIDFERINDMNIIDYQLLLADSIKLMILQNRQNPVDYLNGCWCYMHDKASISDIEEIREVSIE